MEKVQFGGTDLRVSIIVLGTWVIGGWAWGGANETESVQAVLRALELGINFIDTAPVYGFGKSEEILGKTLRRWGKSDDIIIATKCGLEWDEKKRIRRNARPERINKEVDDSLRRLQRERIDLYQVHWPDTDTPFDVTMEAMLRLQEKGKIRYIGLSNFNRQQIEECLKIGPVHSMQPPYNMLERDAEKEILPFCQAQKIPTLVYGGLCRGLLTGKFRGDESFPRGDLRRADPKFKPDRFKQYVQAVDGITKLAASYGKSTAQFALRWALQQPGVTTVIAGARTARQAEENAGASGWKIREEDLEKAIDHTIIAR